MAKNGHFLVAFSAQKKGAACKINQVHRSDSVGRRSVGRGSQRAEEVAISAGQIAPDLSRSEHVASPTILEVRG
jgi:hypothetical protein